MAARRRFHFRVGSDFEFRLVAFSHGWIQLPPFIWNQDTGSIETVIDLGGKVVDLLVRSDGSRVSAQTLSKRALTQSEREYVRGLIPRMLRLDEDFESFWELCKQEPRLTWVADRGAGRILRSPSVFEDLMKLLFTTNCSWAATFKMAKSLVSALGRESSYTKRHAFPTPVACADAGEDFFRDTVRAGYRAKSCVALAREVADGALDIAALSDPERPVDEIRSRLLALPGFGPYAVGHALRLLGRYEDLALDSMCRAQFAQRAGRKKPPSDASIARRYTKFHPYNGLALWMDLTAHWHQEDG